MPLDHERWIALSVSSDYLSRFDGQVAVLVAANLLSRMTPSVALTFPNTPMHAGLPWAGQSIHDVALAQMRAADPHADFAVRDLATGDYQFHLGRSGPRNIIHGTGWNAFLGAGPSPLPEEGELNCIGSSLAVIVAASQLFAHSFEVSQTSYIANAFNWRSEAVLNAPGYDATRDLGNIWTVGVGSVGTAAPYFLSLATRNFHAHADRHGCGQAT